MHKLAVPYLVFGVCSPDFSMGGFGGAFLPHAEIKGANKIATTHIKTRPFLRIFFILSQYQFFRKNLILSKTVNFVSVHGVCTSEERYRRSGFVISMT
jgi:hypothetical protein